jgi:hypothetical protein
MTAAGRPAPQQQQQKQRQSIQSKMRQVMHGMRQLMHGTHVEISHWPIDNSVARHQYDPIKH